MESFDVAVVGAGPAGSTTAYRLARAGARVLLIDRARFPRDKPCGGGLTQRAVRQLPFSVEPVVEQEVDRFAVGFRFETTAERRSSGGPLVLMTQRRRLDAYLAEQAAAAGADFRDGAKVTAIDVDGTVSTPTGRARATVVIGADGVNGVAARALGMDGNRRHGVALEGNVPYTATTRAEYRGRALAELGTVDGGYSWIFPKGDHVNVGVGGWEHEGPHLRAYLDRLCAERGIDRAALTELRGFRLPMRTAGARASAGRILLAGDAAGLIDPLSGDGMYEAFVSGRIAAETALEALARGPAVLGDYDARLDAALGRTLSGSMKAKLAFDRFPRFMYTLVKTRLVWRFFEAFIRGDVRSTADARGAVRAPLRLVEALSRLS